MNMNQDSRVEDLLVALDVQKCLNGQLTSDIEKISLENAELRGACSTFETHLGDVAQLLADERAQNNNSRNKNNVSAEKHPKKPTDAVAILAELMRTCRDADTWTEDKMAQNIEHSLRMCKSQALVGGCYVDRSRVKRGKVLGEGAFGVTYRAAWQGVTVALKCQTLVDKSSTVCFLREYETLSKIRHPHLLSMYGACFLPENECWLLTEYFPDGTVTEWLHGKKKGTKFIRAGK